MTKEEMAIFLFTHAGERIEVGYFPTEFGFLLEDGYAKQYCPRIDEYASFTEEEVKLVRDISNDAKVKEKWENTDTYKKFDYDLIESGIRIYEEFDEIIPNNDYYTLSDESDLIFETYDDADADINEKVSFCGYNEITPYLELEESDLKELCDSFKFDRSGFDKIQNKKEILQKLEEQITSK